VQRLDGVDVPEPRHHLLIQERRLQRRALAGAGPRQRAGVEARRERLRPEPAQRRVAIEPLVRTRSMNPNRARIVEDDVGADARWNTT
jgi:hypothetical protein